MKAKIIYACVATLLIVSIAALGFLECVQKNHIKSLQRQVGEQSKVIDSLLTKRDRFVDVELYVTDKSKSTIYGKYNKGNITMPQEKTYHLEIDSTNVTIK